MQEMIWIVEDEPDIRELQKNVLEKEGFACKVYSSANEFMRAFQETQKKPDAVLLDIMLPDRSGFDLIPWIRAHNANSKILCVSAMGKEIDKVKGLDLGADDYIVKPFSLKEMVSRVRAVLRRATGGEGVSSSVLQWEGIYVDVSRFYVAIDGEEIFLTATEFRLLTIFLENPGRVFSREVLIQRLWNNEKAIMDRTIDAHVKNLREKLKKYGTYLKTLRGIGYKLDHP